MAEGKVLKVFTCCLAEDKPLFHPVEAESFEEADEKSGRTSPCIIFGTDEEVDAKEADSLPDSAREIVIENETFPKFAAKGTFFFGDGPYVKIEELAFQKFKDLDGYKGVLFAKTVGRKKIEIWGCLESMFVLPE